MSLLRPNTQVQKGLIGCITSICIQEKIVTSVSEELLSFEVSDNLGLEQKMGKEMPTAPTPLTYVFLPHFSQSQSVEKALCWYQNAW